MDIRKKRFPLKATVLALLALNMEVAKADPSCPAEIRGTALAGLVCNFNTQSSVTVENGGNVGGISMDHYAPDSGQITIAAGGTINNPTATGIFIGNSTLSNGLVNNGTIDARDNGIFASNSTIGSITNNGSIESANATGINLQHATINGNITNNGTITAGSDTDGIFINDHSEIGGDLINNGTITSGPDGNAILIRDGSTIDGSIVNNGLITTNNTGILAFVTGTISGDLVNTGFINAGVDGIRITNASEVGGEIANSGLIYGGKTGVAVKSQSTVGSILNVGVVTSDNTGIAVKSTSTVSGGIINSGIIGGGVNAIYIASDSHVDDIDIVGQRARVIGNVNAVGTDFNLTSGSVFTSEGDFDVKNFNIDSNAVFTMANAITVFGDHGDDGVLNNAGTLALGNNVETLTGNYTQNSGGTLQIGATSASQHGQLVVTNAADLSSSGNINVQVAKNSSLKQGDILSNVISGGSLIDPTDGFTVTDNSFLWKFTANPNSSSGVDLTATIDPSANSACQGSYCQGAANVIIGQVAAGNSAFGPYAALATESAFKTAASQATPELTNSNIQALQLITQSVTNIVPMWTMLQDKPGEKAATGKVWVKPYGGSMMQDENNSVPGFNTTIYGVVIGRDIQPTENSLFGAAFAAGKDNIHGRSELNGQSIYSDDFQGMLYGTQKFSNHLYLAGQGLVGYQDNNTKRSIPLYASTAKGSYNSWFTNLQTELGWNFYALNHSLVLTPSLDANYLLINQGSYKESGSTMDLAVDSSNNSSLFVGAYGNGAYHLATFSTQQDLTLTGYAGVARNILHTQPETTASFIAGGPSFSTEGAQYNGYVFRGGAGLVFANPKKPLSVSINYDLQSGNNAYSGVGSITLAYKL